MSVIAPSRIRSATKIPRSPRNDTDASLAHTNDDGNRTHSPCNREVIMDSTATATGHDGGYAGGVSTVERPELGGGIPKKESEFVRKDHSSSYNNCDILVIQDTG